MIKSEKLFVPELKTKFRIIEVDWEPHSESTWTLQYKSFPIFRAYEKVCATKEKDERLVGQEIEAHIDVSVDESAKALKKEKKFLFKDGWVKVTGLVEDSIEYYLKNKDKSIEKYIDYKLNSVFPVKISSIPEGAKIGDWITIEGEASIIFPWS